MNKRIYTNIVRDSYTNDQAVLWSKFGLEKYELALEGFKIKTKDLSSMMKDLKDLEFSNDIKEYHFNLNVHADLYIIMNDKYMVKIETYDNKSKVEVNLYFNTLEIGQITHNVIKKYEDVDSEIYININSFFFDAGKNIKTTSSTKIMADFDDDKDIYYPFLDTKEMFKQYLISDSNILLLAGEPGGGKSRLASIFMKYLLEELKHKKIKGTSNVMNRNTPRLKISDEVDYIEEIDDIIEDLRNVSRSNDYINVAYVKDEELLSKDLFWNILKDDSYNLLFLDDLDYALLPRTQTVSSSLDIDKNKFISNLLSFTDGLFKEGNNLKLIITTNRELSDIDKAVLRKGRTFDIIQLRKLTNDEAKDIWLSENLPIDIFDKEFGNSKEVLQADLGSSIVINKKSILNNIEIKPYVLEEGISLYANTKKHKKIGF